MYKILLADDEGIMIDSLDYMVAKQFGKQCRTVRARNGQTALEQIQTFQPEIAILDIRMPDMTGIEVLRKVRQENKRLICILLSAYDEFDYAQEAINLNVMEYLTKPVSQKIVVEALQKAMQEVDRQREEEEKNRRIQDKMNLMIPVFENNFIYSLIFKEYSKEEMNRYKKLLELSKGFGFLFVLLLESEAGKKSIEDVVNTQMDESDQFDAIRIILKRSISCKVGALVADKIVVFVEKECALMDYQERISTIKTAQKIVGIIQQETGVRCRIGIGTVKPIPEMSDSYEEAVKVLSSSAGNVEDAYDFPIGYKKEGDYPAGLEKNILKFLQDGNTEQSVLTAAALFSWIKKSSSVCMDNVQLKVLELVLIGEYIAYSSGAMTYRFYEKRGYIKEIERLKSVESLYSWFVERLIKISERIKNKNEHHANTIIEQALQYLSEQYKKDLSLEEISEVLDISPYYFSRLFKEVTGMNFISYLNDLRINKAKGLLRDMKKSMKEICFEVGYGDPNYFSRIFKKHTGVTPTEYRERVREQG